MGELKPLGNKARADINAALNRALDGDDTKPLPTVHGDSQAVAICVGLILAGAVIGFMLAMLVR